MTEKGNRTEELSLTESVSVGESQSIADLVRRMIQLIGEDPDRDGLRHTPERFEKALRFLTSGYHQDPEKLLNGAMFSVCYDQMVLVKDIEIYSLCEHHMLPFFGKCHVAYIPDKKVVGLSKIPRLVNMFARRLQIQERLTNQIASAIQQKIAPLGVGVVVEARHLCMVMRGVEKQNSQTVTSAMLGAFRENVQTREEFLSLRRLSFLLPSKPSVISVAFLGVLCVNFRKARTKEDAPCTYFGGECYRVKHASRAQARGGAAFVPTTCLAESFCMTLRACDTLQWSKRRQNESRV